MGEIFYTAVLCIGLVILYLLIKNKCFISGGIFNLFTGIGSLVSVNLLGYIVGIQLPVTLFSFCLCAVMGLPGTVFVLAAKYICV